MEKVGLMDFYGGKRVFITGHTGFKGSWLSAILILAGAEVCGYALEPPTDPSLFCLSSLKDRMRSETGDVRDSGRLGEVLRSFRPEFVFHLAAQPLVRESYRDPVLTYETNVMGTVNLLEDVRKTDSVRSVVNVTTDKVYRNDERGNAFREEDILCGGDPYSNSKSCSDIITSGYRDAFLRAEGVAVSSARAGNVIGGGDYSRDRIIPDCIRAAKQGEPVILRNPFSVRPYQHVLEPVMAYLLLAQRQTEDPSLQGEYNIGPDETDVIRTWELADLFCREWGGKAAWKQISRAEGPREADLLRLNCAKAREQLGWKPCWNVRTAVRKTVEWEKERNSGADAFALMIRQIEEYAADLAER